MKTVLAEKLSKALRIVLCLALVLWPVTTTKAQQVIQTITLQQGTVFVIPQNTAPAQFGTATKNYLLKVPANVQSVFFSLEVTGNSADSITLSFFQSTPGLNTTTTIMGCQQASYGIPTFVSGGATGVFTVSLTANGIVLACPAMPLINLNVTVNSGTANFDLSAFSSTLPIQANQPVSATGFFSANSTGAVITEKGGRWSLNTAVGAGVQATASRAATAGIRHVADCIEGDAGAATAPAATVMAVVLRDGASGAGTIIWQANITAAATAAQHGQFAFCGLNLPGSVNTAMTVEFTASLANEVQHVALTGFEVQ